MRKWAIRVVVAASLLVTPPAAPQAGAQAGQSDGSARGIFVGGTKLGVSAEIEIERDGKRGLVPTSFEFKTGDRFWLNVTVNRDAYVYILNRTLIGPAAKAASAPGARAIVLQGEEDTRRPAAVGESYTLVFPAASRAAQLVKANTTTTIPGSRQFFAMDQVPGVELVAVLASETPIQVSRYFDVKTGHMLKPNAGDSVGATLARLNGELAQMAENAETEEPPRSRDIKIVPNPFVRGGQPSTPGGRIDRSGQPAGPGVKAEPAKPNTTVSVAKQPGKPMLMEIKLIHLEQ